MANGPPSPAPDDASADQAAEGSPDDAEAAVDWQAFVPTDTADHLATMDRAARDSGCGVPWHLLAAIARIESDFGRNMATSSAGAMGYGQFLPSSWRSFGSEGNVYDYRDALPAIATYLCQSGLERDPRAALFAYNHAEWYVDLVLDLAVRYDRLAPGAPTPDVLDVGPAAQSAIPMHYAAGRDVRRETQRRTGDGQNDWLGVPWRGRAPGATVSAAALAGTAMAMVRAAFGLPSEPAHAGEPAVDGLNGYVDRALAAGLLGVPVEPPVQLAAPDERRPAQTATWSLAEIRRDIDLGQPVVALVASRLLPGHAAGDVQGDQPLVLIGKTASGLVYSDPSFSSSLGYGLELSDADFLAAWQAAASPARAVVFSDRREPAAGLPPTQEEPTPAWAALAALTVLATPTTASALVTPTPATPTPAEDTALALPAAAAALANPAAATALATPPLVAPATAAALATPVAAAEQDVSWIGPAVVLCGALLCALLLRSLPARPASEP